MCIISIPIKLRLFNTTCLTMLLSGRDSWALSVNMEIKINAFATSCYWIMLNIKHLDCVSIARIHKLTSTQPTIDTVRQGQLCFLGHIFRMTNHAGDIECTMPPDFVITTVPPSPLASFKELKYFYPWVSHLGSDVKNYLYLILWCVTL